MAFITGSNGGRWRRKKCWSKVWEAQLWKILTSADIKLRAEYWCLAKYILSCLEYAYVKYPIINPLYVWIVWNRFDQNSCVCRAQAVGRTARMSVWEDACFWHPILDLVLLYLLHLVPTKFGGFMGEGCTKLPPKHEKRPEKQVFWWQNSHTHSSISHSMWYKRNSLIQLCNSMQCRNIRIVLVYVIISD